MVYQPCSAGACQSSCGLSGLCCAGPRFFRAVLLQSLRFAISALYCQSYSGQAEFRKMWLWMRGLPTCMLAGRGWAFNGNGLWRLSSPGGSAAMQGVQLFESIGAAKATARGESQRDGCHSISLGACFSRGAEANSVSAIQFSEAERGAERQVGQKNAVGLAGPVSKI